MKMYFVPVFGEELCYSKDTIIDMMKFHSFKEVVANKAIPIKSNDHFYCSHFGEVGEKGDCGKQCYSYTPKNGKNGCCKYVGKLYETGEEITIKINKQ